jgi:peptide/nickel transport system substrate-binding protein
MNYARRRLPGLLAALLVVLSGCTAPAQSRPPGPAGPGGAAAISVPAKAVQVGILDAPTVAGGKLTGSGGAGSISPFFSASLVRLDYKQNIVPQLAAEVPSLERGTWKMLGDNRMETIYLLKPGLTFHDGAPFTAEDVLFTWQTIMRPDFAMANHTPDDMIEAIEVVDPLTVLIRWKEPYIYADRYELEPLARHLLEPLAQRDAQAFMNSSLWNQDWIGLGPYKVVGYEPGVSFRGEAFADYVLGAPKIQQIHVFFDLAETVAMVKMLAGERDVLQANVLKLETGLQLKEQLEARGLGIAVLNPDGGTRVANFQFREPLGPPARDVRVRQALVFGLDRVGLSQAQGDLYPIMHWFSATIPTDGMMQRGDAQIKKYPYDPVRATQLLTDAGWNRGPAGVLRNVSGERFDLELQMIESPQDERETQAFAENLKALGVNTMLKVLPRSQRLSREERTKFPGLSFGRAGVAAESYVAKDIPAEENKWQGTNYGGYTRPDVERLIKGYTVTISSAERMNRYIELQKSVTEDLPSIPLHYTPNVHPVRNGLRGVIPTAPGEGWNSFQVEKWYWAS